MDRIPYHLLDGVTLDVRYPGDNAFSVPLVPPVAVTSLATDLAATNDESSAYWAAGAVNPGGLKRIGWVLTLPEPYDLTAYFVALAAASVGSSGENDLMVRSDGGTWVKWVDHGAYVPDASQWATARVTPASPSLDVVQVCVTAQGGNPSTTMQLTALHLYGQPSSTTDRLRLWDPTLDQAHAGLDFGSVNPSEVKELTFRLKNTHLTDQANSVVLSASDLTGDMADGIAFSADDVTYTPTLDIGNLAAGVTSPVLHVRRTVPASPTFGHQQAYVSAVPGSWS